MREHIGLFRGKRIDNGEWVEGCLIPPISEFMQHKTFIAEQIYCASVCDSKMRELMIGGFAEVDPDTIGECTGLKDKNGKLIFEGDIIKIPDDYNEFGHNAGEIYEIYFCCGGFRLKPKYSKARGYWLEDDRTVEIIGTVRDNPELLKGGEG